MNKLINYQPFKMRVAEYGTHNPSMQLTLLGGSSEKCWYCFGKGIVQYYGYWGTCKVCNGEGKLFNQAASQGVDAVTKAGGTNVPQGN